MDIFVQKDSTCFHYRLKLNHHNKIKGGKQVQNNITTLHLGIQDVEVTGVSVEKRHITIDCKPIHDRVCPHCGSFHAWVHDHRVQVLQDAPMRRNTCFPASERHAMIARIVARALKSLFPLPLKASR